MRNTIRAIVIVLLTNAAMVTLPLRCLGQNDAPIRGPIDASNTTTAGSQLPPSTVNTNPNPQLPPSGTDNLLPSPAGATSSAGTATTQTGSITSNDTGLENLGPIGTPASDASTDSTIIHDPTKGPSNVSIPMDINFSSASLFTNPNTKPKAPPKPLSAVISNVEFTTDPNEYLFGEYHGLCLHVHNGTDQPLLLDGDQAVMHLGTEVVRPISIRQLNYVSSPTPSRRDQIDEVVKVASTVGLADMVKDEKIQQGPILGRYGGDERRRQDEQGRFGKRILWPGEKTDGMVYFQTEQSLKGGTIELPIASFKDHKHSNAQANHSGNAAINPNPADTAAGTTTTTQPAPGLTNNTSQMTPMPTPRHNRSRRHKGNSLP